MNRQNPDPDAALFLQPHRPPGVHWPADKLPAMQKRHIENQLERRHAADV